MTETTTRGILIWMALLAAAVALTLAASCGEAEAKPGPWRTSLATQFGSKTIGGIAYDRYQGHRFFCTGQRTDPYAWGIASRTIPCGSLVEICRGKLCVIAPVITTGPFVAVLKTCRPRHATKCFKRYRVIARRRLTAEQATKWQWAGDLDLLPRVAWAVRLLGRRVIRWRVLWRAPAKTRGKR